MQKYSSMTKEERAERKERLRVPEIRDIAKSTSKPSFKGLLYTGIFPAKILKKAAKAGIAVRYGESIVRTIPSSIFISRFLYATTPF